MKVKLLSAVATLIVMLILNFTGIEIGLWIMFCVSVGCYLIVSAMISYIGRSNKVDHATDILTINTAAVPAIFAIIVGSSGGATTLLTLAFIAYSVSQGQKFP